MKGLVLVEPAGIGDPQKVAELKNTPSVSIYGDFIEQDARWPTIKANNQKFQALIRGAGGEAEIIDLPQQGIRSNSRMLIDEPKKNAPGVLALALGFIAGSGGADANGGIPDTDIAMFGIGDHRSLFTHSIIAGVVVEGSILALADFAGIVCNKLPEGERSAFWDQLDNAKDQIALKLAAARGRARAHPRLDGGADRGQHHAPGDRQPVRRAGRGGPARHQRPLGPAGRD